MVTKGCSQQYGSNYYNSFSLVDKIVSVQLSKKKKKKIVSVRLLRSMVVMHSSPLFQLDIKKVFLHGDLAEEVYMEQPSSFVAQTESSLVCKLRCSLNGLKQSPQA